MRGAGYTRAEVDSLLSILEELLPISAEEWEEVSRRHADNFGDLDRSRESLKRKYTTLANAKPGTGTTICPPEVLQAKRIKTMIEERAGGSEGGQEEDMDSFSSVSEEEEDQDEEGDEEDEEEEEEEEIQELCNDDNKPASIPVQTTTTIGHSSTTVQPEKATVDLTSPGDGTSLATTTAMEAGTTPSKPARKKTKRTTSTPQTVVVRKRKKEKEDNNSFDMNQYMRMCMMERQMDRDEDRRRQQIEEQRYQRYIQM